MSKITTHGGDVPKFDGIVRTVPSFGNPRAGRQVVFAGWGSRHGFWLDDFVSVEKIDQQSAKRLAGTLGWGFVGAVALGPLGALAGLMTGGQQNTVTFAGELQDGRKLVATVTADDYHKHIYPATLGGGNVNIPMPKAGGRIMWQDIAACLAVVACVWYAISKVA